ncbi:hypothetical protein CEXT_763221 [Caerostris extrusa]|uniref:Maturase K n=1 Tax=Caerostris extrusa TaxID=172846 RepID=A0AAV4MQN6_CAEEX|nr:hypothetical protein CEXT_763221 [Caerostris extrusa]
MDTIIFSKLTGMECRGHYKRLSGLVAIKSNCWGRSYSEMPISFILSEDPEQFLRRSKICSKKSSVSLGSFQDYKLSRNHFSFDTNIHGRSEVICLLYMPVSQGHVYGSTIKYLAILLEKMIKIFCSNRMCSPRVITHIAALEPQIKSWLTFH